MQIVYFSGATENTHVFVTSVLKADHAIRIPLSAYRGEQLIEEGTPYILIVPTYGTGRENKNWVPAQVRRFLNNPTHVPGLKAVVGTGNINFREEYAIAADIMSSKFRIPIIHKVELWGNTTDVQIINECIDYLKDVDSSVTRDQIQRRFNSLRSKIQRDIYEKAIAAREHELVA